jgi:DNA-directed RNA polymerase specialized sigma24 family protein
VPHHVELESFAMAGDDPSLRALDDAALDALLASLPPQIARVARTVACDGITWAAACRRHSVSPRMVEGHLRRLRRSQLPRSEDVR